MGPSYFSKLHYGVGLGVPGTTVVGYAGDSPAGNWFPVIIGIAGLLYIATSMIGCSIRVLLFGDLGPMVIQHGIHFCL